MYLSNITIENFRCFGEGDESFKLPLNLGLTALVGENDAGKTAVIDAIRFALGTTDQDWHWLEDTDFHIHDEERSREIRIVCKFEGLTARDKRAFVEYFSYAPQPGDDPVLFVNWTARDTGEIRKGRTYWRLDDLQGHLPCEFLCPNGGTRRQNP